MMKVFSFIPAKAFLKGPQYGMLGGILTGSITRALLEKESL